MYFDGDLSMVLQIFCEEDGRHTAPAYFPVDTIATGDGCREPLPDVSHEHALPWEAVPLGTAVTG
ncbi:MAG: hypothetical protein ACKVZ0_04575 [Gemmatimonadales bacterium]